MKLVQGITASNQGMMTKYHAFYGEQVGYTLPLKANTTYVLNFKYAGWGNTPTMHINVYAENGTRVSQSGNFTTKDNAGDKNADSWTEYSYIFTTTEAGNYVIGLIKNTGGTEQNQAGFTDISLFKAQPVNITIKADRNMPLDFIGSELTAEIVTSSTGTTQKVTKVPANTGIIVGLAEATTEAKTISVPVCAGETDAVNDNMLVAVLEKTTIPQTVDGYTNYVFGKGGGKEQFFKVRTEGMEVPANNAYLAIPSTQAKGIDVIGLNGDATGISTIENADMQNGEVYNLQGQKVNRAQKGVYIVNGKKVILK